MDAEKEMAMISEAVSGSGPHTVPAGKGISHLRVADPEHYKESVRKASEIMKAGDVYVMNLTHTIEAVSDSDPFGAFLRLRGISPSPYGAYMDMNGMQIISSSMELLIDIDGDLAVTRPIKGTAPRTGDASADAASLKKLMSSDKERSELLMVTDLERNDMNRFCVPGSVKVDGFFVPEEYATVFHTVSEISGRVREGIGTGDMISCMFPGGSVTGAPKLSAMKHIDLSEGCGRGIYTGTLCMLSGRRSVMNIAIRTMVHRNGIYRIGVGSGITWESDPDGEYEETMYKAKAMLRSLE
jgi:para-aminobenzoate synthetase component 1